MHKTAQERNIAIEGRAERYKHIQHEQTLPPSPSSQSSPGRRHDEASFPISSNSAAAAAFFPRLGAARVLRVLRVVLVVSVEDAEVGGEAVGFSAGATDSGPFLCPDGTTDSGLLVFSDGAARSAVL